MKPGETSASFNYPQFWGGHETKCREPLECHDLFDAPLLTGLEVVPQNDSYYEFSYARYR